MMMSVSKQATNQPNNHPSTINESTTFSYTHIIVVLLPRTPYYGAHFIISINAHLAYCRKVMEWNK